MDPILHRFIGKFCLVALGGSRGEKELGVSNTSSLVVCKKGVFYSQLFNQDTLETLFKRLLTKILGSLPGYSHIFMSYGKNTFSLHRIVLNF